GVSPRIARRRPRGPLRRPGLRLVWRASGRGHPTPARADRVLAMKRALLIAALWSTPPFAYNEAVHAFVTRRALPDVTPVSPPSQGDLDAFRQLFWKRASAQPEFARSFPTPES